MVVVWVGHGRHDSEAASQWWPGWQSQAQILWSSLSWDIASQVDVAVVFVQLIVELALEVTVDHVAMWAETEHGVPVTHYFALVRSTKVFVWHVAAAVFSAAMAMWAYIRHPHFLTCGSSYVCDCVDQPQYTLWLGDDCAWNASSLLLRRNNNSTPAPAEDDISDECP